MKSLKTYRYLYGTDLAGAYEEIFRSEGLTAYLRDKKHIIGVSNKLEEIRGLYSFDKLNGYGQHPKKGIPLVVQYMPMPDLKLAIWGVGGAANAGNEGVWADLSNNTGRSTTYTQLELFDLAEAAGTGNYNHLDILFGMEKLQDQDVVDARNGRRDMRANVRIEHVAPVMRQMDKEHVLAAAESLYAGKHVVFHLERGISFPYRSRELLMQLYSMLPPLFAKEIGYSCYCRADSVKDLTRHGFRVFVVPGEEPLDSRDFPEKQYLILDMSSRRNAGSSEMWGILESWWEMPWAERVEVMRWQFRDTDQLASTHNAGKFISTSSTYQEKLRSFKAWKAQKTSIPTGVTLEDLVDEYSRYKFWDEIPGAKETFARWSKLVLGGEEMLLDQTENAFAELAMGTDAAKQRTARRQYNLGSQLCSPRGSGLQKNIQSRIDSKVTAKCAQVVEKKNAEIQALNDDHNAQLVRINNEISKLKSDHSAELQRKDGEISALVLKHVGDLNEKENQISDLKKAHEEALEIKGQEIEKLNEVHEKALWDKDQEIRKLNRDRDEKLGELNGKIDELNTTLEGKTKEYTDQIGDLNAKLRELEMSHGKEISTKEKEINDLRAEVSGLQVMLDGNNAAKRLDWLMGIPVLGLGVKALVNHKFACLPEEDKPVDDQKLLTGETSIAEEELDKTPSAVEEQNVTPATEAEQSETPTAGKAPSESNPAEEEGPDIISDLALISEQTGVGRVGTKATGENGSDGKSEQNGKKKGKEGNQKTPGNNRLNILFAAVIALFAVAISALLLVKLGIIPWPPVLPATNPTTTAGPSESPPPVPSESTTAPTEPVVTTVPSKPKFEMTQELVDKIVNELQVSAQTELAGFFADDCGLKPVVLFSEGGATDGKLPQNYVLVLEEAPEKADDLYAYIGYGALHIAVNLADKGNDNNMKLAFDIFEKLFASVEYPEGIQFYARLNKAQAPVDLVYTFQKMGIEDWYLHVESWKSGDSTKDYKTTNKLKFQPTVVVEGEGWSVAYIPGDIYNDPEERENLKSKYKLYQTMDTGWAVYLIDGQDAPTQTGSEQTEDSAQNSNFARS